MRPIIVGIDPGTTSAYAAIDFDLNLIGVESKKDFGISEMISKVMYLGDPVLIGTDKKEIPSFIRSFSNKVGAKIVTPGYDTKKGEKKRLVQESRMIRFTKNVHEVDALASALYAYSDHRELLKKMKAQIKEDDVREKAIPLVILESMSIARALELVRSKGEEAVREVKRKRIRQVTPPRELSPEEKQILLLTTQNIRLRMSLQRTREELEQELGKEIDLDAQAKKLLAFKERRILFLEKHAKRLEREKKELQSERLKLSDMLLNTKGSIVMRKLRNLTNEEYGKRKLDGTGVLFVEDISAYSERVVRDLEKKGVRMIIFKHGRNPMLSLKLIPSEKISIRETRDFVLADEKELERAARETKGNIDIGELLDEYRKERKLGS